MIQTDVGKRLKVLRKAKGMTQKDVAQKSDLTTAWVCNIERGKVSASKKTLERLANVFDVSIEYLLTGNPFGLPVNKETEKVILAKELFRKKQYEKLLNECEAVGYWEDELHAIRSRAYMVLAAEKLESKNFDDILKAIELATLAKQEALLGIYANSEHAKEAERIKSRATKAASEHYSELAVACKKETRV